MSPYQSNEAKLEKSVYLLHDMSSSVLELLLNVDRGFGENKKGRTLKNLEFSPLVEPGGVELPSKQATY